MNSEMIEVAKVREVLEGYWNDDSTEPYHLGRRSVILAIRDILPPEPAKLGKCLCGSELAVLRNYVECENCGFVSHDCSDEKQLIHETNVMLDAVRKARGEG